METNPITLTAAQAAELHTTMLDGRDMPKCENCDKDVIEIGATHCSLKCTQQQSKGQEDAN